VPSKGRRVVIKRVVAVFIVIILLAPVLVFIYRESGRPVLQFDSRSDAIDIKTSERIWVDEANNIHDEESTAGRVILNIHGGGDFSLERVEIRINETALDVAYVAIANGPLPPADSIAPHYSETTVVMPVTVTLPAYVAIHVDSKRAIFGGYMKVHIVGTWISLGFRERIDLNAETALSVIPLNP
jgi:hypothetical protein